MISKFEYLFEVEKGGWTTTLAPENWWLEDDPFLLTWCYFQEISYMTFWTDRLGKNGFKSLWFHERARKSACGPILILSFLFF